MACLRFTGSFGAVIRIFDEYDDVLPMYIDGEKRVLNHKYLTIKPLALPADFHDAAADEFNIISGTL